MPAQLAGWLDEYIVAKHTECRKLCIDTCSGQMHKNQMNHPTFRHIDHGITNVVRLFRPIQLRACALALADYAAEIRSATQCFDMHATLILTPDDAAVF